MQIEPCASTGRRMYESSDTSQIAACVGMSSVHWQCEINRSSQTAEKLGAAATGEKKIPDSIKRDFLSTTNVCHRFYTLQKTFFLENI